MPRIAMERSGELEVFARVVATGSFSAAARSLDLTPSAVSKLVARLEDRLGTRLLVRTTRAVALTDEGAAYFEAAQGILRELQAAEDAASMGAVRGRLAISASQAFGQIAVVPAVLSFRERHPDLQISLSLTDDLVDLVAARVDVAIRMGTLPDSALVARKLGTTRRILCAAPAYLQRHGMPQTPADLAQHCCLGFTFRKAGAPWPMQVDGRVVEVPVFAKLLVNNGETLRQMALAGAGIARIGRFHVAPDIARADLVPVLEGFDAGDAEPVHAIHVGGGPLPPRVGAFIEHLARAVAESRVLEEEQR